MSREIRDKKLLYHLTSINNLESIFERGLLSRSRANFDFDDVADEQILDKRQGLDLETYVPFHFYSKTPFAGIVQELNPDKDFVHITMERKYARKCNWKIVPTHPLSNGTAAIYDYDSGFDEIDWDLMETGDYRDPACKLTCMAECLSPNTVTKDEFFSIYVPNKETEDYVSQMKTKYEANFYITQNANMFKRS